MDDEDWAQRAVVEEDTVDGNESYVFTGYIAGETGASSEQGS